MANVSRETNTNEYDAIIIGAGLSGCGSAALLDRYKLKTLIINISMDNPAFIKSINKITLNDNQGIKNINKYEKYFLNNIKKTSLLKNISSDKQNYIIDKKRFSLNYKIFLETQKNIDTRQGLVEKIDIADDLFKVYLNDGENYYAKYIIVSCGTFFNAYTIFGTNKISAGRNGEISAKSFPEDLKKKGISFKRLTTSIPAAIDGKNIRLNKECIDSEFRSPKTEKANLFVINTYVKKKDVKSIINEKFIKNYINNNNEALKKFNFVLYPESRETKEYIIDNFFSTQKETIQEKAINKIHCLEDTIMTRPSYLIEYDGIKKEQLNDYFETKKINNLYFPGEINGTGNYIEIVSQGILAASNIINKHYKNDLINFKL